MKQAQFRRERPASPVRAARGWQPPKALRLRRLGALAVIGIALLALPPAVAVERSAWSALQAAEPRLAEQLPRATRQVLRLLTWEQLTDWRDGVDPALIVLADGRTLSELLGVDYAVSWHTIDGGGGGMSGGGYALAGSFGQADAGELEAAGRTLSGGYWPLDQVTIFSDDFESGDTTAWTSSSGAP